MNETKNLSINVELKSGEDIQLFSQILTAIMFDAAQDKKWLDWINAKDILSVSKASSVLVVPMMTAFMKAKELLKNETKK